MRGSGVRAALALMTVMLLAGCAALPEVDRGDAAQRAFEERSERLAAIETWRLVARLGLDTEREYWSAQLNWRVQGGTHILDLSGPMGRGGGRLTLAEGQPARLVTRDGQHHSARDPDVLAQRLTGDAIPVSGMVYWVRGLPDPAHAYEREVDAEGRPIRIRQAGWEIEYGEYEEFDGESLPVRMELQRDALTLRAVIRQWQMGDGSA
ncbi:MULTISPECIES: lipoprotein insertase outer membrane protein LolB [unclassified Thioalkalivibrio]|uniref:lipoprotein insertase outer membrane protein LolB n=1 Tax=unclassified Thioalkalivibrio TaxID=2621013 RepID=UPI0018C9337F|nr:MULTISPECIES: lipoprotein insertase outer membrane protein LolB [unclassified Thioalkalivibrio]